MRQNIIRKQLTQPLILFIGLFCLMLSAHAQEERPNFIVMMADDVSARYGCYGDKNAKTPHIDTLAESGVMFNTAWATPMCGPTRTLLTTGRYAHRTGAYHNSLHVETGEFHPMQYAKEHLTFAQLLRKHGYATAIMGNMHTPGGDVFRGETGFDEHHLHLQRGDLPDGTKWDGATEGEYKLANPWVVPSRYWHPCIWHNGKLRPTGPEDFGPDLHTDFLIDFMKRKQDEKKPFIAYYPMSLPHNTAGGKWPTTPLQGRPGKNEGGNLKQCNDYIDVLIGRIADALDETGLRDNTILIYTSDNGDWPKGKMWATEYGARVPLVINAPGHIKTRGATNALTEFSDIFPTLMDYAGVNLPKGYEIDGQSLMPFLKGRTDTHRDTVYSYIGTARLARDAHWLLEGYDPLGGAPNGRLYYCGDNRSAKGYKEVTGSNDPEAMAAQQRLEAAIKRIPHIDPENPEHRKALDHYSKASYRHKIDKE